MTTQRVEFSRLLDLDGRGSVRAVGFSASVAWRPAWAMTLELWHGTALAATQALAAPQDDLSRAAEEAARAAAIACGRYGITRQTLLRGSVRSTVSVWPQLPWDPGNPFDGHPGTSLPSDWSTLEAPALAGWDRSSGPPPTLAPRILVDETIWRSDATEAANTAKRLSHATEWGSVGRNA